MAEPMSCQQLAKIRQVCDEYRADHPEVDRSAVCSLIAEVDRRERRIAELEAILALYSDNPGTAAKIAADISAHPLPEGWTAAIVDGTPTLCGPTGTWYPFLCGDAARFLHPWVVNQGSVSIAASTLAILAARLVEAPHD